MTNQSTEEQVRAAWAKLSEVEPELHGTAKVRRLADNFLCRPIDIVVIVQEMVRQKVLAETYQELGRDRPVIPDTPIQRIQR